MKKPPVLISRRSLLLGAGGLLAAAGVAKILPGENTMSIIQNTYPEKMPVMFIGHGSPMNAIEENEFTRRLAKMGQGIAKPKAILCVSAHWLSAGTWVTAMDNPKTIHDFGGFPQELFDVNYPAPGKPELAELIAKMSQKPKIQMDSGGWGLDHGSWAILRKMYPDADVPVLQLSIDMSEPPEFHFELGKILRSLREQGVLIVGSGNIVHNLRRMDWHKSQQGFDWAIEFDEWAKEKLLARDFQALTKDFHKTMAGNWSIPTLDHYLPLLYVLGAADPDKDALKFDYEGMDMGSISMRCLTFSPSPRLVSIGG